MKEVYEQLLEDINRLKGKQSDSELQQIFKDYIYDRLTDEQVLDIIKTKKVKDIDLPDGLKIDKVLRLALIMIEHLKKASTWQEFTEYYQQPQKENIDFDQLIQHLLKQQKPPQ